MSTATRDTALRLRGSVADAPLPPPATAPADPSATPRQLAPNDPRWVLAMRVRESMQGTLLPAENRARLLKLGRLMGLNGFESNLVIAIVQDAARRGEPAHLAEASLAMVPRRSAERQPPSRLNRIAWTALFFVAFEALVLYLLVA